MIWLLKETDLERYREYLIKEERSPATVKKYGRDALTFWRWLPEEKRVDKESVIRFKLELSARLAVSSVNSMLVAINGLLKFIGCGDCCVKLLKTQRSFCSGEKELSREEYFRLLKTAQKKDNERIFLVMQTICSTGIRVSELRFITLEGVKRGDVRVSCKGKARLVMIPKELKKLLLQYCKRRKIYSGLVFRTKNSMPLNRSNIWTEMKSLCAEAKVDQQKVFPHNLRHLFAQTFYRLEKDPVRLADILGHSNVETTRIYTTTSNQEHRKMLSQMNLIIGQSG